MMAAQEQELSIAEEIDNYRLEQVSSIEAEWDYAPDFLGLPHWRTIAVRKTKYDYEVIAEPLTLPRCPDCDRLPIMLNPTGTLVQSIKDEPRENRRVEIHFIRQRFECPCGRSLMQPLPGVVKGRSITQRGAQFIALECFHLSFDDVGLKIGVSGTMAKEVFSDFVCALEAARTTIEAPEVLGIDGVCVGRRKYKRSYCTLTDISNSRILELLNKSTELELARFLKQLPNEGKHHHLKGGGFLLTD
jgi:transposase